MIVRKRILPVGTSSSSDGEEEEKEVGIMVIAIRTRSVLHSSRPTSSDSHEQIFIAGRFFASCAATDAGPLVSQKSIFCAAAASEW